MSMRYRCAGWRGRPPRKKSQKSSGEISIDRGTPEFQSKKIKYQQPLDQLWDHKLISSQEYEAGTAYREIRDIIYKGLQLRANLQSHAQSWGKLKGNAEIPLEVNVPMNKWKGLVGHLERLHLKAVADYLVDEQSGVKSPSYQINRLRKALEEIYNWLCKK